MHPYLLATLGGALIGLAASLLLLLNGRIAGVSGIIGGLFTTRRSELGWRAAFVFGLIAGGVLLGAIHPEAFGGQVLHGVGWPVAAGLLVGFGTLLGGGCTSGHGVCGVARGAGRSIAATATFVAVGAITVFVFRHLLVLGGALK